MTRSIVLILGSGANVGRSVARKFAADGYLVAISARSLENGTSPEGYITIKADYSHRDTIPAVFDNLKAIAGIPNVVIYNAVSLTRPPPDELLSIPIGSIERDLWVNTFSPLLAAQHAVQGFEELPATAKKVFIYTGNILNSTVLPVPEFFTLGITKAASAYWVGASDLNYSKRGFRFYYADERTLEGAPVLGDIDAEAHADFYKQLVDGQDSSIPWLATFAKGRGYVNFPRI